MKTAGIFVCDGCEKPIDGANIIPMEFQGGKSFSFAFCMGCDNTITQQRVLTAASKKYQAWKDQNPKT